MWAVEKYKQFIQGYKCKIMTDHSALHWLYNKQELPSRLARWLVTLREYDLEIIHRKGKMHQDADTLSRYPVERAPDNELDFGIDFDSCFLVYKSDDQSVKDPRVTNQNLQIISDFEVTTINNLRELQQRDKYCTKIMSQLNNENVKRGLNEFLIIDDILMKTRFGHLVVVVPKKLINEILFNCHDHVSASHLGFEKTYDKIKSRYFWPHMLRDIKLYCDTCVHCQTRKRRQGSPPGLMMPIKTNGPWDTVGIDILGSFPKSTNYGNRYIVVCTDLFTKYIELRAIPDATAETIADFLLNQIIYRHSMMRKLLSDRGKQFTSEMFKELVSLLGINQIFTTAYHPATNGNVERFNSTLASMISMYVNSQHRDWDLHIQAHAFAYNVSKHKSTNYSPFELLYGRKAILPFEKPFSLDFPDSNTYAEYLRDNLDQAIMATKMNIDSSQTQAKSYFDRNRVEVNYDIGELVLIKKPIRKVGHSSKLFHD